MKNDIFIHKKYNYDKILAKYIVALIPLILYGFYKNGVVLYLDKSIEFIGIFKPILFPLIGSIMGLIVNIIRKKNLSFSPLILYGILIGLMMPLSSNIILYSILVFILLLMGSLLEDKFSINYVSVIKLLIVVFLLLFKQYNYLNPIESTSSYAFSFVDLLFGRQVGGVCTSSFIWIIISFIYLCTNFYYKKEIPIFSYLSYALIILLSLIFTKDLILTVNYLVAADSLFSFVFIAPISVYSPYTNNGKVVFSILIGVISATLTILIGPFESALIAISLVSIFKKSFDSFFRQKITK